MLSYYRCQWNEEWVIPKFSSRDDRVSQGRDRTQLGMLAVEGNLLLDCIMHRGMHSTWLERDGSPSTTGLKDLLPGRSRAPRDFQEHVTRLFSNIHEPLYSNEPMNFYSPFAVFDRTANAFPERFIRTRDILRFIQQCV